jgi:hypothetical protein
VHNPNKTLIYNFQDELFNTVVKRYDVIVVAKHFNITNDDSCNFVQNKKTTNKYINYNFPAFVENYIKFDKRVVNKPVLNFYDEQTVKYNKNYNVDVNVRNILIEDHLYIFNSNKNIYNISRYDVKEQTDNYYKVTKQITNKPVVNFYDESVINNNKI